jgi:hypothetical protein
MSSNKRWTLDKREEQLRRALASGASQATIARAAEAVRESQLSLLKKAESGVAPAGPRARSNIESERRKWLDASVAEVISYARQRKT